MAQGGARKGQPGKSYSNRTDLNINRAPMPGASGNAAVSESEMQRPELTPDSIPNLDVPTQFPDEPVTAGLPYGPGDSSTMQTPDMSNTLLYAALRRNPDNADLQRIAAYMQMRENV